MRALVWDVIAGMWAVLGAAQLWKGAKADHAMVMFMICLVLANVSERRE